MNARTAGRLNGQTNEAAPELSAYTLDTVPEHAPAQFVVDSILPRRHVTLLSGHGGSGKTTLALAIGAHVACGIDWGGLHVEPGHVAFVSLEDEVSLCAWRLRKIAAAYGLSLPRIAQNLVLLDGVSADAALAVERCEFGNTDLRPTAAMGELVEATRGCSLVIVDNASDALWGDANSQATVRTFMRRLLGKLARERDCAVLLLAHIDKLAARGRGANQNFIGSVSWHNSARCRLALTHAEPAGLVLDHEKSNLCRRIQPIRLVFNPQGIPVPAHAPSEAERADATGKHADALLRAIRAVQAQGGDVVLARTGTATTQRQLDTMPAFPPELRGTAGRLAFWAAIDGLLGSGHLKAEPFSNAARKTRTRLIPADEFCAVAPLLSSPIPPAKGAPERRTPAPFCSDSETAQNGANGATAHTPQPEIAL
ncbi:AAA family ATPase [Metallibacterium sp.]|uniref:AAA family ATPase n=1 Tax=Metallibacterium sp. TaxID=2940281 RepID=UPI00260528F9|nr:AAA family ATPase [Metallibacterium sp.]